MGVPRRLPTPAEIDAATERVRAQRNALFRAEATPADPWTELANRTERILGRIERIIAKAERG
jgi:hypothetical protein